MAFDAAEPTLTATPLAAMHQPAPSWSDVLDRHRRAKEAARRAEVQEQAFCIDRSSALGPTPVSLRYARSVETSIPLTREEVEALPEAELGSPRSTLLDELARWEARAAMVDAQLGGPALRAAFDEAFEELGRAEQLVFDTAPDAVEGLLTKMRILSEINGSVVDRPSSLERAIDRQETITVASWAKLYLDIARIAGTSTPVDHVAFWSAGAWVDELHSRGFGIDPVLGPVLKRPPPTHPAPAVAAAEAKAVWKSLSPAQKARALEQAGWDRQGHR